MTSRTKVMLTALLCLGAAACMPEQDTGFVEIKRKIALQRDDVLLINKTAVTDLATKDSAIVKQPTGSTTLMLKRGERQEKLCEFTVGKNRVTTVTLNQANALVRCSTQS